MRDDQLFIAYCKLAGLSLLLYWFLDRSWVDEEGKRRGDEVAVNLHLMAISMDRSIALIAAAESKNCCCSTDINFIANTGLNCS